MQSETRLQRSLRSEASNFLGKFSLLRYNSWKLIDLKNENFLVHSERSVMLGFTKHSSGYLQLLFMANITENLNVEMF